MKDKALEARLIAFLRDTDGLFVVETLSGPDGLGRSHFAAFWWADNIGYSCNETGVRGQHFFAVVGDFMSRERSIDGSPLTYTMLSDIPEIDDHLVLPEAA